MEKILLHACCGPCAIAPITKLKKDFFEPTLYFFNPNIHGQIEFLLRLNVLLQVAEYYQSPTIIETNKHYFENLDSRYMDKKVKRQLFNQALKNISHFEQLQNEILKKSIKKILYKWYNYQKNFNIFPNNFECLTSENINFTWLSIQNSESKDIAKQELTRELNINPIDWVANLESKIEKERCKKCYTERLFQTALFAAKNNFKTFTSSLLYSRYQNHEDICFAATKAMNTVNSMLEQGDFTGQKVQFHYQDFREFWQDGIDNSKNMGIYRQKYCGCILSRFESLFQMAMREYNKKT